MDTFTIDDLPPYVNGTVDEVVAVEYSALPERTRARISPEDYWLVGVGIRRHIQNGILPEPYFVAGFVATRRNDLDLLAKSSFEKLLFSDDHHVDVKKLINLSAGQDWAARRNPEGGSPEDPWLYLKDPNADASHSVYGETLFSKDAAPGVLTASRNIHFDMFPDYFDCVRIQFPAQEAHRNDVSSEFLKKLGFSETTSQQLSAILQPHAENWAKCQVILFDQIGRSKVKNEPLTQRLLEHLLTDLLENLQQYWQIPHVEVIDVTGMAPVSVPVAVSEVYMTQQAGGNPTPPKKCRLVAKCDLSVSKAFTSDTVPDSLRKSFLQALFNIEVKSALTMLRGEGCNEMTQTIVESLARALTLGAVGFESKLFSILCDVGCLNVLVHDTAGRACFLSHREIAPGRMVAVIAWVLHNAAAISSGMSHSKEAMDTVLSEFVEKDADGHDANYKDNSEYPDNNFDADKDDDGIQRGMQSGYGPSGNALVSDELTTISDSESEDEFDAYQREKRAASMALYKYRIHGKQLPLLTGVLRQFDAQEM